MKKPKGNKTFRGNVLLVFVGLVKFVIATCVVILRLVSATEEKRQHKEVSGKMSSYYLQISR